mgnify:CR=1 FL=1
MMYIQYLINSLDQSLNRLDMDYVDIFYRRNMKKDMTTQKCLQAQLNEQESFEIKVCHPTVTYSADKHQGRLF